MPPDPSSKIPIRLGPYVERSRLFIDYMAPKLRPTRADTLGNVS